MGMHQHIYVGPYVRCTYRKETKEVQVLRCPKTGCQACTDKRTWGKLTKFCSLCGTELAHEPMVVPVQTSSYDVLGDAMTSIDQEDDGFVYLIPNVRRPGRPDRKLDSAEPIHLSMFGIDTGKEMSWIATAFEAELALLRKAYDNVEICWGFHQYFM